MAKCVYPSCDAAVISGDGWGYCATCGGPMQACGRCGALNRSLARQCRSCSAPLEYKNVLRSGYGSAVRKWSSPDTKVVTQERFWLAPLPFAGWLWLLSAEGQLSRYSPFSGSLTPIVHLGQEFGCAAPLLQANMSIGSQWSQPAAAALSPEGAVAVGMIDGRQMRVALEAGELALADFTKEPCGLAGRDTDIHFFTRRNGSLSLVSASLKSGRIESRTDLPDEPIAGPLCCAGEVFYYTQAKLSWLSGTTLKSQSFPAGFQASLDPRDPVLRQGFGRLPFMVRESGFYIPGRQSNRPVFLLHRPGRGPAIIPISGESIYVQDGSGRPVLAQESRILILEDSVSKVATEDGQLIGMCPGFSTDELVVGMAQPSPASLRLRLYRAGVTADFFVQRDAFRESIGVYALGNSLSFCATLKDTTIGIYSWIC